MASEYNRIDGLDCKLRTWDEEHPTKTLWSKVDDTQNECVISSEELATHTIKIEETYRQSFEGTIVVESSNGCIQYEPDHDDIQVEKDGTRIRWDFRFQGHEKIAIRDIPIKLCDDKRPFEYLQTVLRIPDGEPRTSTELIRDGGNGEDNPILELTPEVQIEA